jgi:hypothetical protein
LNTSKLYENLYPWIATGKKLSLTALKHIQERMLAMWLVAALRQSEKMLVQAGRLAMQVEIIDHLWTRSVWLKQARRPPTPKIWRLNALASC